MDNIRVLDEHHGPRGGERSITDISVLAMPNYRTRARRTEFGTVKTSVKVNQTLLQNFKEVHVVVQ